MEDKSLGPKTPKRRKVEASKKRAVQSNKISEDATNDEGILMLVTNLVRANVIALAICCRVVHLYVFLKS